MAKPKKKVVKSPRPQSVRVFFVDYRLHWYSEAEWLMGPLDNDMQGQCDTTTACIHMRVQPDVHEQTLRETLWHEILHAIFWHMGFRDSPVPTTGDQEEEIIVRISHAILTVQQDNPEVMAYLASRAGR